MPKTIPVAEPTDAIETLLLVHLPPLAVSDSVIAVPTHKDEDPAIAAGDKLTVTVAVAIPHVAV